MADLNPITTETDTNITATLSATVALAIHRTGVEKRPDCRPANLIAMNLDKSMDSRIFGLKVRFMQFKTLLWLFLISSYSLGIQSQRIQTGAEQTHAYFPKLKNKRVGVIANQTSVVGQLHLVDTLRNAGINVVLAFGPEHGFRGNAGAGEHIQNEKDPQTGIPIVSLYGKNKKPSQDQLNELDILIFDIQDVGTRFYTYISTMSLAMEAAAEKGLEFMILDRPNPNGSYIDGPILEPSCSSFVGMHPVPIVHGMTVGEYAKMINEEGWMSGKVKTNLTVIACKNYTHSDAYSLPIPPSPNLPNMASIYLYPSLCLFEGTEVSVGRGTDKPFQRVGFPGLKGQVEFKPISIPNAAPNPPHKNKICGGYDLDSFSESYIRHYRGLYLLWLEDLYQRYPKKEAFFNSFFDKLAGTASLRKDIVAGKNVDDIRASWQPGLEAFKKIRKKYLLYPDFE